MFRKVSQSSAKDDVARQIVAAIDDGRLAHDQKLPSERDLADQFAVSRATIREAMQHLQARGIVDVRRGLGTFVRGGRLEPQALSPEALMETRFSIEPYIAQLCAVRATGTDVAGMAACLEQAEQQDGADFARCDNAFHLAMARATRNALLVRVAEDIFSQRAGTTWGSLKERSLTPARIEAYRAQHRAILDAIASRDGAAAQRSMRVHLIAASYAVLGGWPTLPSDWVPDDLTVEMRERLPLGL